MKKFQKLVVAAWFGMILLVGAGAIVRVTGSGLGCPDWPKCWACFIPPTSVEEVDFEKIDIEKFRKKAERLGRDPETITRESLRDEFDPVATWIEFVNRLLALPVSLLTLAVFIASVRHKNRSRALVTSGAAGLFLVIANALIGAMVVYSGLKPGIITLHMALAMVMTCNFIYGGWKGTDHLWKLPFKPEFSKKLKWLGVVLFVLTVVEGILGSQVRELTDQLLMSHKNEARELWADELEGSFVYLAHRSFSWLIVLATCAFYAVSRHAREGGVGFLEKSILGIVLAQMILGIVMAHIAVFHSVQVFHVVLSAVLLSAEFLWLLGVFGGRRGK